MGVGDFASSWQFLLLLCKISEQRSRWAFLFRCDGWEKPPIAVLGCFCRETWEGGSVLSYCCHGGGRKKAVVGGMNGA